MENGILSQIISDHFRNKIIDSLVIRNAVSRRIHQRHISPLIYIINMGDADHRFLLKRHRIQIFIRDSPVNSPHPLPFTRIVNEIQHVVLNRQLASRHQMRSCLLSKIGMLKISGVIPSRRENHRMAACVAIIHGAPEQCGIISIVFNMILLERIGTASAAQFSRYHRIRSA